MREVQKMLAAAVETVVEVLVATEPVAVMEAQLSGLPVVSTRHAGIPDVVLDGSTGLLVAEGDVRGMAAAMERLMADSELAVRFGRAGRDRVLAGFMLEHHLQDLTGFLQQQIKAPDPRRCA